MKLNHKQPTAGTSSQLTTRLKTIGYSARLSRFCRPSTHALIGLGLNDIASEGDYVWTSGEASGYFNWDPNYRRFPPQPDGPLDDVVAMVTGEPEIWTPGTWHDFYTAGEGAWPDVQVYPLVEVKPVPEPSTVAIWSLFGAIGLGYGWWRVRRPM